MIVKLIKLYLIQICVQPLSHLKNGVGRTESRLLNTEKTKIMLITTRQNLMYLDEIILCHIADYYWW